jgi:hypothetical protein
MKRCRQAADGGRRAARPDQTTPEFCFIPLELTADRIAQTPAPNLPGIRWGPALQSLVAVARLQFGDTGF